jgi:transmembrane sensor
LETQVGEMRDIALDDGSVMHLNSDSEAEVRFTDRGRKVRLLKGEASFDVAHDPSRPFDVEARSAVIRAVGTAFTVRLRPSMVELTVTKGIVSVRAGGYVPKKVAAGGGAVIQPRSIDLTRLNPKMIGQRVAWREQMVELDGETIEQAATEFNRYRKAPILIGDTRVSSLRLGGRFRTTDSKAFLTALQMSLPVRAVDGEEGSVMLLYRDEAEIGGAMAVN